jgi:DNA-binding response OmpR family regulator
MPLRNVPLDERISILAISAMDDDHRSLAEIFRHSNWELRTASALADALRDLDRKPASVVLCARELPDGDWKRVLSALNSQTNPVYLVVASDKVDDRLWAEVLNLGGYDVLPKPFRAAEVFPVLNMAWRNWRDTHAGNESAVGAIA